MIKVLLMGIGRWGANHLRVLHTLPVDLFVSDVSPERLVQARNLRIPDSNLSTDPEKFANTVDCAVVVTPAQTHFKICRNLLESGKDVFVEKPITVKSEEAGILTQIAERNKRILQVGHIFRFDPASQWIREAVKQGKFGRIKILRGNFSGFKRPRHDTGVTFADSIHFVDLFNYFMGHPPARVTALLKDFMGRGMDDESFISMDYESVAPAGEHTWATVKTGYHMPGKFREVTVIGDELSAVCDFNVAQYKIKTFQNKHVKSGEDHKAFEGEMHQLEFPPEEPLLAELRAFIESVETRRPPLADGWAGYEAVRVLEAALESAQCGRTVALKSDFPIPQPAAGLEMST